MLRKSLFWGLTLVLTVALTNLIIRGCRLEKEKAHQLVETVEEAKPTLTRVLQPQDLKIVQSKMELEAKAGKENTSQAARHEIEIFNGANVPYKDLQLRFVYLSRAGKALGTKSYSIAQTIQPGATLKLANIGIEDVPRSAENLRTTILYADIATLTPPKQ